MEKTIQVTAKNVYGKVLFYPKNKQAEIIARISWKETLTPSVLIACEDLGYTVEPIGEPLNFKT